MPTKSQFKNIFRNLEVGIGEASKVTGVSQRQLRYWEEKGYIVPLESDGGVRTYSLGTLMSIAFLKDRLDDGYTLATAVKMLEEHKNKIRILSKFGRVMNQSIEVEEDETGEGGVIKFGKVTSEDQQEYQLEGVINKDEHYFRLKKLKNNSKNA